MVWVAERAGLTSGGLVSPEYRSTAEPQFGVVVRLTAACGESTFGQGHLVYRLAESAQSNIKMQAVCKYAVSSMPHTQANPARGSGEN